MRHILVMAAIAGLLAAGCATSFEHMQEAYVSHDDGRPSQIYPRLKGKSCEWRLLGLIPITGDKRVNQAVAPASRGLPAVSSAAQSCGAG